MMHDAPTAIAESSSGGRSSMTNLATTSMQIPKLNQASGPAFL
jgi:hypothetical protein